MAACSTHSARDLIIVQGFSMQETLKEHYDYIGSSTDLCNVTYRCKYCKKTVRGRKNTTGNFRRHLEVRTTYYLLLWLVSLPMSCAVTVYFR